MKIDYAAAVKKRRQQQERAREKQLARLNSPEYQAAVREKSLDSAKRQAEKQRAKQADPEYRAKQIEKAIAAIERRKANLNKTPKPTSKPKAVKKVVYRERSKTSHDKTLWDELGQLPCAACLVHGKEKYPVAIHHMNGRSTEDCHKYVIPLCDWHHDTPAPIEAREQFNWLVPRHAKGSLGGKPAFEKANATERELMLNAYTMIGRRDEALKLLAL